MISDYLTGLPIIYHFLVFIFKYQLYIIKSEIISL